MRAATSIPRIYAGTFSFERQGKPPKLPLHRRQYFRGPSRKERAQDDKVVVR